MPERSARAKWRRFSSFFEFFRRRAKENCKGKFLRGCRLSEAGAYDLVSLHHALRARHISRGSAGNKSEFFGIMITI